MSDEKILQLLRIPFGKFQDILNKPSLLAIQIKSFDRFIHNHTGQISGIEKVLQSFFPIRNNQHNFVLRYISYTLGDSLFNVQECILRGLTYAAPIKVKLSLILYPDPNETDKKKKKTIVNEQEIYLCDIPLMTKRGSFVINGTERVVVSQLQRSPGVFFDSEKSSSGNLLYNARIMPARGPWLDFEFDSRDCIYFRIDRKRKLPVSVLIKGMNWSVDEIITKFLPKQRFKLLTYNKIFMHVIPSSLLGKKATFNIYIKNIVDIKKGEIITFKHIKLLEESGIAWVYVPREYLVGFYLVAKNYINESTGEIICMATNELTSKLIRDLFKANITNIETIELNEYENYIIKTLMLEKTYDTSSALKVIDKYVREGYSNKKYSSILKDLFFSEGKYNLSEVGRTRFNQSFPEYSNLGNSLTLTNKDIIVTLQKLIDIRDGLASIDDLDHLGNRRIISVGEMLENIFRLSLFKMGKRIKEKLLKNKNSLMPEDVINVKPISSFIKEFFTSSQLSQFMDQTNPLSEITHKRRISALGPGGITRERANFEVRDVHTTHYGRICPIETPEGPNIGLINSFALYAHVNKHGFIETPYRKVIKGKVTNSIEYLNASTEGDYIICQADAKLYKNNEFLEELIVCRYKGESSLFHKNDIDYMDISTQQIVSIGAALIPFIEHNDANRALMGANMQRQAVPLLITEKPLIGTGLERKVAIDAGVTVVAKRGGIVHYVDASRIVIQVDPSEIGYDNSCLDIYKLTKFFRSNQNTCIHQRPCVMLGEQVRRGDIIADGPATDMGELALGKNLRVAFMSWYGYNFEDSIIISERVVQEELLSSIHINELICIARETNLGVEEITADIPNIRDSSLSKLDEFGIIAVGTEVKTGDILVGKVTPKGGIKLTPEEKLLRAIFGEKAYDVIDTSLRVPSGMSGTVIDVQIFSRYMDQEETDPLKDINKEVLLDLRIISDNIFKQIKSFLKEEPDLDNKAKYILDEDKVEDLKYLLELNFTENRELNLKIDHLRKNYQRLNEYYQNKMKLEKNKIEFDYELAPGIIQIVKIYLATKRNIQPGDKIAGRHGNKGVVSKISRIEDMPYDEDGIPVDIILNPLSVPSRMNVGQIFETHLGLALKKIGSIINQLIKQDNLPEIRSLLQKVYELGTTKVNISSFSDEEIIILANNLKLGLPIASPVFDGVTEDKIKEMLKLTSLPLSGQIDLYDGCTGEKFEKPITVGYMYILKLNHLVDEKIHARSTGSYSLVTQQPLGGKSQFGGQRFGEMEVWALEAYGASFTLQELLTVKSDDVSGRTQLYQNLVDGNHQMSPTIPESFNVLLKEIKSLGINLELLEYNDESDDSE